MTRSFFYHCSRSRNTDHRQWKSNSRSFLSGSMTLNPRDSVVTQHFLSLLRGLGYFLISVTRANQGGAVATISHTQVKSDIWDKKRIFRNPLISFLILKPLFSFYKIKPSGKTSAILTHTLKCSPPHTYTHTHTHTHTPKRYFHKHACTHSLQHNYST